MEWKHIKYEENDSYAIITINNPEKMNSMDNAFIYDIEQVLDKCENNKEIRCAILTGAGKKAFTSGGNVKEERDATPDGIHEYNRQGGVLVKKIMKSRMPYIAAVNGYCLGAGVGLITACDLIISAENAVYGLPTIGLGGIPGWGCTQTIVRIIGPQNAKMMLLANENFTADEMKNMGLVNKVVKLEDLIDVSIQYAEKMASYAPNAIKLSKYAINKGLGGSLEEGIELESKMLNLCNNEYNFKEGISAFLEKRPANFKMS